MKPRKFADEGFVREGENENIDDDTRARARKFVEGDSARVFADPDRFSGAKPKVVTKEELAKSGLSLRDYMNQQQGLTRRGGATAMPRTGQASSPMSREDLISKIPLDATRAPVGGERSQESGACRRTSPRCNTHQIYKPQQANSLQENSQDERRRSRC